MTIEKDDIRAAVTAGVLTEDQAARLAAFSRARMDEREILERDDERFELFSGFNEIFVVVGLGILYAGWFGTYFAIFEDAHSPLMFMGFFSAVLTALLAKYFTATRRMIAPSIALAGAFAGSAAAFGCGVMLLLNDSDPAYFLPSLVAAIALLGYWRQFRVPFTMALIAGAIFWTVVAIMLFTDQAKTSDIDELFLLTADGPLGLVTFIMGLIGFAVAMRFDMSDPHRITRRSDNGFWLHIIAAPALVNTIALSLFDIDTGFAKGLLLVFVLLMAVIALIIDRRSFLLAAVGYVVALAVSVIETGGGVFVAIFLFGLLLIALGSFWERLRVRLMTRLPDFPGKDLLPPYSTSKPSV